MRSKYSLLNCRACLFLALTGIVSSTGLPAVQPPGSTFDEARVAILWENDAVGWAANDQASFAAAFRSVNIQVDTLAAGNPGDLTGYNLLILPYYSAQHISDPNRLREFVGRGGKLILDGHSTLAETFDLRVREPGVRISRLLDPYYPEDTLRLLSPDTLRPIEPDEKDEIFSRDALSGEPVVTGRNIENGKILYLGILFDPVGTVGCSRFPFLLQYVWDYFHLRPVLRRDYLEMYFDPGYRHQENPDSLVQLWVKNGVRVIHAAAWHQHPTWSYNYARLVQACHAKGILIYAWFEPPLVSEKFWNQYPEWKEVNFRGEPIPPQWRFLEALTDSLCLERVKTEYTNFLNAYDWDGVNVGELYFESDRGPRNPLLYTPMHPSARSQFAAKNGFDPALLFDSTSSYYWKKNHKALNRFERYRTETIVRLHDELLNAIDDVRYNKGKFDVIVTTLDERGTPLLTSELGVELRRLQKLQKKYDFTLQVEDPQSRWSNDPRRYEGIGNRLRTMFGRHFAVMLDLNILNFRNLSTPNPFPTAIQTGTECYQMISSAAAAADRVTLYSESTIRQSDLRFLPYASSFPATILRIPGGWKIASPFPFVLELPATYTMLTLENGQRINAVDGRFELPEGEYTILKPR